MNFTVAHCATSPALHIIDGNDAEIYAKDSIYA